MSPSDSWDMVGRRSVAEGQRLLWRILTKTRPGVRSPFFPFQHFIEQLTISGQVSKLTPQQWAPHGLELTQTAYFYFDLWLLLLGYPCQIIVRDSSNLTRCFWASTYWGPCELVLIMPPCENHLSLNRQINVSILCVFLCILSSVFNNVLLCIHRCSVAHKNATPGMRRTRWKGRCARWRPAVLDNAECTQDVRSGPR